MKNSRFHMNIGGASILLLMAVFALTVFAVLSIRASYKERQMAVKTREAVEAYYAADAQAEELYAQAERAWKSANGTGGVQAVLEALALPQGVKAQAGEDAIVFEVSVDHNRVLKVALQFDADGCTIRQWQLASDPYGSYTETIEIWDGVFVE